MLTPFNTNNSLPAGVARSVATNAPPVITLALTTAVTPVSADALLMAAAMAIALLDRDELKIGSPSSLTVADAVSLAGSVPEIATLLIFMVPAVHRLVVRGVPAMGSLELVDVTLRLAL